MKKFCDDPATFVSEMMEGLILANPRKLKWIPQYNIVYRCRYAPRQQGLSRARLRQRPRARAHMVVGRGMFDAACPGNVFAAPPMDYVSWNETSKLMNAAPRAFSTSSTTTRAIGCRSRWVVKLAEAEDVKIATIIVDDDVAVKGLHVHGRSPRGRG